jgi:hypothetical protein
MCSLLLLPIAKKKKKELVLLSLSRRLFSRLSLFVTSAESCNLLLHRRVFDGSLERTKATNATNGKNKHLRHLQMPLVALVALSLSREESKRK